jgi:uncharacterized protein (TIGR03000 family)
MTIQRCMATLLAASVLFGLASSADAFGRRTIMPPVYNVYPYGYVYPQFNPYVAPLPAYGILPQPLATYQMWGYDIGGPQTGGNPTDTLNYVPRSRPNVYPAVPYEPSPAEREADRNRARFEIKVPTKDAIVIFDGKKTTQTGLTRSFVTPALGVDKLYTATIEVSWQDEAGTTVTRRQVFNFVAGETLTHQFKE